MPSISAATAITESSFLEKAAIEVDEEALIDRISPVFDVFTQHLSTARGEKALDRLLDSIYVIGADYCAEAGFDTHPIKYSRAVGAVEVAEHKFDEVGYLECGLLLRLGHIRFLNPFRRKVVKHYKIAADAVAAFYLEELSNYGLPQETDNRILWIAKNLLPVEFQGKKTKEASFRLGNLAREKELRNKGVGLQLIYENTK